MKRILALVLAFMMVFSLAAAVAETPVVAIESLYDGAWVKFEDGFELYLPADWYEFECSTEMNAQGIFYMAGTEDLSYCCTLAWQPMEADCSIEELQAEMVKTYPDASVVDVNGVALIAYVDVENNLLNCVALDATEPGFYLFAFSPADDENFSTLAALIASTIRNF